MDSTCLGIMLTTNTAFGLAFAGAITSCVCLAGDNAQPHSVITATAEALSAEPRTEPPGAQPAPRSREYSCNDSQAQSL